MSKLPKGCRLVEEDTGTKNQAAFHITCEDVRSAMGGDKIARIQIHKKKQKILGKTVYTVSGVVVDEAFQRRGLATVLYEAAAVEACRRKARLASTERNFEARSLDFWLKQERKGRAIRVSQRHLYKLTDPGKAPGMYDAFMLRDCEEPIDLSGFQLPKLTRNQKIASGVGALLLVLAFSGYNYGGSPLQVGVDRDPKHLIPSFAKKLNKLFSAMRARGYKPLLWEGLRTPERASQLAAKGLGISNSLHIYGAAADIVDESTAPRYWDGAPGFWTALGQEAKKLGLTWGGDFSSRDLPHVQAITVAQESRFRAAAPSERAAMAA